MLHSHTEYCDGHATMEEMSEAAYKAGFKVFGFSPHSPLCIPSPCNMKIEDVPAYLHEADRLKMLYEGKMKILKGMEIDYLSKGWGPSSALFRELPLDYRIGSVHFVPTQKNEYIDCDGSPERFAHYLHEYFADNLEYVCRRYFEQVESMIEAGGFDILGHLDKISSNAKSVDPYIEERDWWAVSIRNIIDSAVSKGLTIEINTKMINSRGCFFPALRWWGLLKEAKADIIFNTDAHWPDKVTEGLTTAKTLYEDLVL